METKDGAVVVNTNKNPFILTAALLLFWGLFPLLIFGFMFFVSYIVKTPFIFETNIFVLMSLLSLFFLGFFVYLVFFSNMRKPAMILNSNYITLYPHFKSEQKIAWHDIKHIYLSWWRPGAYNPKIFGDVIKDNSYVLDIKYIGKRGKNEQIIRRLNSIDISRDKLKKLFENYPAKVQSYDDEGTYPEEYKKRYFNPNMNILLYLGIFMIFVGGYSKFTGNLSYPILTKIMDANTSEINIILISGGIMFMLSGLYSWYSMHKSKKNNSKLKNL
jgi:hypothetical protein